MGILRYNKRECRRIRAVVKKREMLGFIEGYKLFIKKDPKCSIKI
jgi:hypothetical protein